MIGMLVLGRPWEPAVATPLWPPLPHRQVEADAILRMALAIVIDSLKNLGHVVDNVERTMLYLKNLNEQMKVFVICIFAHSRARGNAAQA